MEAINLFDGHCDTLLRNYERHSPDYAGGSLRRNRGHVDLERAHGCFGRYAQFFAVFADTDTWPGKSLHQMFLEQYGLFRRTMEENDLAEPTLQVRMLEREDSAAAVSDSTQLSISSADYQVLLKIVEAEAGSEDLNGRILVANVVLNRVKSELFPDCVTDVVYQHSNGVYQFSPVKNGTIDTVSISEETKQAVELALDGTDLSKGALYFAARNAANEKNMRWFDTHLVRLFAHGGHEFFG